MYVTKQQHQVWACGSCERPIFKPSLSDVKRHVTACTVVKGISVSPHDSLDCHLLAWRRGVGLAWFGDWVDDRFVRTHAKRTHTNTHTQAQKGQDTWTCDLTNACTCTGTWTRSKARFKSDGLCDGHSFSRVCKKNKGHEMLYHSSYLGYTLSLTV